MEKLIVKGGFRERANRQRKYQNSENQQKKSNIIPGHRLSTSFAGGSRDLIRYYRLFLLLIFAADSR